MTKPSILERILPPRRVEKRENEAVTLAHPGWLAKVLGTLGGSSETGIIVNTETALQVPAVWASVNFISRTVAGLPLNVYTVTRGERRLKTGVIADMLARAPSDEMTSFDWRKWMMGLVLTEGRAFTYIERNAAGNPVNLWPMDFASTTVRRVGGLKTYETRNAAGDKVVYGASDVIDVAFMLSNDMLTHRSPLGKGAEAIGLSLAAMRYGAKIFRNGGVPPLVFQGPFQTEAAMQRASDDLIQAIAKAYEQGRQALGLPLGHEVKPLGFNPENMQLVELQRWCVEQVARIYGLPPTFLQDLTNGTHSNTEQQDLHFVKHTLRPWLEHLEQELNLKLFGRRGSTFVEFDVDALLRADLKTRMEGFGHAVQNGLRTPNELRAIDGLGPVDGGDVAYIQGGTVPLRNQASATIGQPVSDDPEPALDPLGDGDGDA